MSDYILQHHGIKGQKWGVRRFQNPDGTRTEAGKVRQKKSLSERVNEHHEAYVRRNKLVNERNREANSYLVDFRKSKTGKNGGTYDKYRKGQRQYASGLVLGLIGGGRVADVFRLAGAANSMSAKMDAKREANQFIRDKYGDKAYKEVKKRDIRTGSIAVASVIGVVGYKMLDKKQD